MENTLTTTRDTLLKDVDLLKKNVLQFASDVHEQSGIHVGETKKKVTDSYKYALDQATAHPFALLGIGLALGLLIGYSRKSS